MKSSKEKILHVAQDLFYQQGYLATSVDDIIGHAGVSKSNFYYHFKSKEELGIAVLDLRKEDFRLLLTDTLCNESLAPDERLSCFLRVLVDSQETQLKKGGCPFGNLVAEMAEHNERFRCRLSEMFGGLSTVITGMVAEGQQQSLFRRDVCAEDMAALIVQATQGMLLMTKCHKSADDVRRGTRVLVRLIGFSKGTEPARKIMGT